MYGYTKLCKKHHLSQPQKNKAVSMLITEFIKISQKVLKLWKIPSKTQDFACMGKLEKDKTVCI